MKVEKKRWLILVNGEAVSYPNDGSEVLFFTKEEALRCARERFENCPEATYTVQEWTVTEEIEIH
jgi:hypothetical protein